MKRRSFITALLGVAAGTASLPAVAASTSRAMIPESNGADAAMGVSGGVMIVHGVLRSADGSLEIDLDSGTLSFHPPGSTVVTPLVEFV